MDKKFILPKNLVVLISGVPGVGKTTISYQLLKIYSQFRLIEETDVMREILRGYNNYLESVYKLSIDNIYSHDIFLSYEMAKQQCNIMKKSIINIIKRQQRKEISTIINGVHIIPEELCPETSFPNILYINLYIDSEKELWNRLKKRDSTKYKQECVPLLYQTNIALNKSIYKIQKKSCMVHSINVSTLSIQETLSEINKIFYQIYKELK